MEDFARLGRLHPLVLHLPIGLLSGALLLEWLAWKHRLTRPALGAFLWLAAVAAVVAAASGWVLSHEEGYGGETLERHEQLGIALAVAAVLAALLHDPRGISRLRLGLYRVVLLVACVLLLPAGHLGSKLTHGEDWLEGPRKRAGAAASIAAVVGGESAGASSTPDAPAGDAAPAETAPDSASETSAGVSYAETVAPVLQARCSACHGPTKRKGGLRLDTREGLLAGGEDGPVLVPGDPAASLLFQRVSLPLDHEDHMPPEGKPQPTSEELATLEAWIAAGVPFDAAAAPAPEGEVREQAEEEARAPEREPGPPSDALGALERALVHHERVAPESDELRIEVAAVAPTFADADLHALLAPLAPWTVELSLARSAITDAALGELARFPALRRLDLRATRVSATGLAALAGHPALEELELAQTKLGDAAVDELLALPRLRAVGLWNAGLSNEALAQLRGRLAVEAGDEPAAEVLAAEGELAFTSDRPIPGSELVPEALRPVNATCPVSGSPVNPKYALVHTSGAKTRVVGFCCPNCPKDFWADPAKFEAKLP